MSVLEANLDQLITGLVFLTVVLSSIMVGKVRWQPILLGVLLFLLTMDPCYAYDDPNAQRPGSMLTLFRTLLGNRTAAENLALFGALSGSVLGFTTGFLNSVFPSLGLNAASIEASLHTVLWFSCNHFEVTLLASVGVATATALGWNNAHQAGVEVAAQLGFNPITVLISLRPQIVVSYAIYGIVLNCESSFLYGNLTWAIPAVLFIGQRTINIRKRRNTSQP